MRIDVLTLFPEMFPGPLGESIIGRASAKGLAEINAIDLRKYTHDARGTVDERPYGGGPGMLMKVEPLVEAVEDIRTPQTTVILTSPRGERFNQKVARELAEKEHLLIIAGHYEGVDERAIELLVDREISLGDFVLTSGNLAAMVMADAVIRLLPGALGDDQSSVDESHSAGLLEYPQYTRPPVFRGMAVPEVLLSGDHGAIAKWRREKAEELTRKRRPDLWKTFLQITENKLK
ncbi:MAG: tRNA (guanosine(37)-N1)-methyltransferase TrmD [Lentisphaeria bacterium]|nr:tRNA (guanosine(37)-N1)-methyltransferase TrmD [Lentisphaeria bacterium]MBQ8756431.1 tRNA (guanosine(37)-N1)-methyltransferase TrmD [Lentisphaeria bacterium]MBQ9776663.1 tRNA (guanosine(37)-N1)-methyltransferase TrmD [Lentisphaeria bacterium]